MDYFKFNKCERTIALLIFLTYLPMIISDLPFRDDLSRTYWGFVGLTDLGRPFADYIYSILGLGFEGVNLSPLPKIISLLMLSFTSINIFRLFFKPNEWSGVFISTLAVCNPFMLQNIAYQYDCLPMAISVLLCTLAIKKLKKITAFDILFCSALLFSGLALYQSSIVVACILCCSIIMKMIMYSHPIKEIINRALGLLISAFIAITAYYLLIVKNNKAVSSRSELAGIDGVKTNLYFLSDRISELYSGYGYILLTMSAIVIFLTIIHLTYKKKYLSSVFYAVSLPVVIMISFMPSLMLAEGFVGPRVLMAIALLPLSMSLLRSNKVINFTSSAIAIILYFNALIVSYAFSGDMKAQYKRYDTISNLVIQSSQSNAAASINRISIHCRSSKSQEESIYRRFNPFISWLNPEEPWAIRFYIRNKGEKRIINDWSNCGKIPSEGFKYENSYFRLYQLGNDYHYFLK